MRAERMSRHLYDVVQIMDSKYYENIFTNKSLFLSIIEHRKKFIGLKGFDYETLNPKTINIIPPDTIIDKWCDDYNRMKETMIYGNSYEFTELIYKLKILNKKINEWGD